MAYLGKEFTFEREENYEEFISQLVEEEDHAKKFLGYRPNQKLEKVGDGYKLTFVAPGDTKEVSFTPGVTTEETVRAGLVAKNTYTFDGDTLVQVQDFGDKGSITYKREYTDNSLKVTVTTSKWDGVAYRWYTAA